MDKILLKKLTEAYGPSGREEGIRALLKKEAEALGAETSVDVLGNLIAHKPGTGKKVLLCAHMDTAGLVVTEVDERGFARVQKVGDLQVRDALNRRVRFANGAEAIVCLGSQVELDKAQVNDLYLDFGVSGRDAARAKGDIGDICAFVPNVTELSGRLIGSGISDRAGCGVLLDVLRHNQSDVDLYLVFSVQERVGGRGAGAAAYSICPDVAVNVHAGLAGDGPDSKPACLSLGAGPGIEALERMAIVPVEMRERLRDAAEAAGVPCQNDVLREGKSDTAGLQRSRLGVPVGVVSIPARNLSGGNEMIDFKDVENTGKLLCAFLKQDFESR